MPGTTPQFNDIIEAVVCCYVPDQISLNVLHYKVTAVASGGLSCQQLAAALSNQLAPVYKAWMASTALFRGVGVRNLTFPATSQFAAVGSDGPGTTGVGTLPYQTSGLIKYITQLGGRKNIGRSYIGLPSTTWINGQGEMTAPALIALAAIANAIGPLLTLSSGPSTTGLTLVIRHPPLPGPPPVEQTTNVVLTGQPQRWATQRRRGDYGKFNTLPF